jgi:hypothetical protein
MQKILTFIKKGSYTNQKQTNKNLIHCFRLLAAKKAEIKRLKLPALRIINRENNFFLEILTRRKQTLLGKLNVIISPVKVLLIGYRSQSIIFFNDGAIV